LIQVDVRGGRLHALRKRRELVLKEPTRSCRRYPAVTARFEPDFGY
jgi:hypothetical protein